MKKEYKIVQYKLWELIFSNKNDFFKKIRDIFLGFLCFLPTIVNVAQKYIYIIISIIGLVFCVYSFLKKKIFKEDYYLIFILISSVFIFLAGFVENINTISNSSNLYIPYTFFIITTIFFSRYINRYVLVTIFILIVLEAFIGFLEYYLSVPYLIEPHNYVEDKNYGAQNILYHHRVYGLSNTISIFSQKFFIGIMLLSFLNIKRFKNVYLCIFLLGLLVSFNRTAIIASSFFVFLDWILKQRKKEFLKSYFSWGPIFVLGILFYKDILHQFYRGGSNIDLSGRDFIFIEYINYIKNNLFLGNFVRKYWILIDDRISHAHNSYLETLASMGLVLSVCLFYYFYSVITKNILVYIIPILLYSVFQYGILWGVSLLDIIFFYFIFSVKKPKN